MRKALRIGAVLLVVGFWSWYMAANWSVLLGYRFQPQWVPLVSSVVLWCGYFALMALDWALVARLTGASVGLVAGSRIWLLSMPARYVPGNVWHVAGRVYLAAQAGVSAEVTIVASVVEQVLTVGSELFVFLVLLPLWPAFPTSGLVVPLLAVSLGLIALHPRNIALVLSLAGRVLKRRIVVAPPGYRHLVFLFACYVAAAVVNGLACYLLVLSLGGSAQSWPVIVGGYLLARSLGFISFFTPAGIGVREGVLTALLTPLLSLPLATAASLWARVLSTAAEGAVVLFVIVVGKAGRRPSRWPRVGS